MNHRPQTPDCTPSLLDCRSETADESEGFIACHNMDLAKKVSIIRAGIPAKRIGELSVIMGISREKLMSLLALPQAAVDFKVQHKQPLSPAETERLIGMESLIGQVTAMAETQNAPQFDAAKWLANWLAAPLPALGNASPGSFMDTLEGQRYVSNLLAMVVSGAYA